MDAVNGDVIKWGCNGVIYYSKVSMVEDKGYGVYVVYEHYGYTQDLISKEEVLDVYRKVD